MSPQQVGLPWRGRLVFAVAAAASLVLGTQMSATAFASSSTTSKPGGLFGGARLHATGPKAAALPANLHVVASGLNQPKKITIGPDGNLIVALSGDGSAPATCTDGTQVSCLNHSGSIARITPAGHVSTVVGGLPSVADDPTPPPEALGPAEAQYVNGALEVLFQNTNLNPHTGQQTYGPGGVLLGDLVKYATSSSLPAVQASFGPYEAAHNPDHGAGTGVQLGQESAIDSDPYAFVPWQGGIAVADAAGNDLLYVAPTGKISVLAVFPTIPEAAPPGTLGPGQTTTVTIQAQAVPDSVTLGPDGALYVGELTGFPFGVGKASVYRVVPGHAPTVFATGFTTISDLAFDQSGRLLVLEIDQAGLNDPNLASGTPTPGALIRVNGNGTRTTLASTGLEFPTGMAVARDGSVYLSNFGVISARGPGGLSGQVVRVSSASVGDQLGANFGGYREGASDGGVFAFGAFGFYGSMGGTRLNQPVVGLANAPLGPGYWLVASDGGIFSFGTAGFYGSTGNLVLNEPIVGMAPTPDGRGYWLVASDGGIFAFGDARFFGSTGGVAISAPIVGISATPDGGGYWLAGADGAIYSFGDAVSHGSLAGMALHRPVVGIAATPDGLGYWLVASDGGIFAFGSAHFFGSTGNLVLNQPVVGLETTSNGAGYNLAASDGGIFSFGNAQFYGSTGNLVLNAPVVAIG